MSPRSKEQFEEIRNDRKDQVLDAALHVFAEEGYHSASVSRIAKRAGVSKGLMYNYFQSKEEVLLTLVRDLFDYVMKVLKIEPDEAFTQARFEEIIALSIDVPKNEPKRWKLYMSLAFQAEVAELLMQEMAPRFGGYMQSMSQYFQNKGYEDPVAAMRIFSALLDGVQMHYLLDPKGFPAEKAKQFLIKQFA
jgi:AcrR family transcriptional regulator